MKNAVNLYVTEDGQELVMPPELVKATTFTKAGLPDKRYPNAEFHAWLAESTKPKCKECGRKEGEGHYDDCSVGMGVVAQPENKRFESIEIKADGPVVRETVWLNPETHSALQSAQAYAMRVWNGQSPEVPRSERIARCIRALEGQNLPTEGVEYPQ